jgi:hypothetical protein
MWPYRSGKALTRSWRIREFAWHQYEAGNLDEKSWQSYMAPVAGMFATERAKGVLNFYTGSPEFARVLADWLRAAKTRRPDNRSLAISF